MQYHHPHHHAAAPNTACPPHHVVAVPVMHMSANGQVAAYHYPHHVSHAPSIGSFAVVQTSSAPPASPVQQHSQDPKAPAASTTTTMTALPGAPNVEDEKEHRFHADTKITATTDAVSDDTHEIAKSVLLLARGGHGKAAPTKGGGAKSNASQQDFSSPKRRDSPTSVDSADSASVPLKKRKMVKTTANDNDASVRVSPVSHSSRSTRALSPENTHATSVMDASHKDNNLTPERNGLPSQVVVVHLPTELYRLLEEQQQQNEARQGGSGGAVIQWLPHGRAWRIVRWDALRREIMPRAACFGGSTSIDAFLAQLSDWGFTEITDGPDAGAYYNAFFRRGFPHLCKDMQYKPRHTASPVKSPAISATHSPALNHETTPHTHVSTNSASSTRTPSILQVPSLASPHDTAASGSSPSSPPTTKRAMATTGTPPRSSPPPLGTYVSAARPNMPFWLVDANQQAVLVQYRPSTAMPEEQVAAHSPTYSPPVRVHSTRGRPSGAPVVHRPPIVTPVRRVEDSCASSTVSVGSFHKKAGGGFPISRRGRARSLARPISHSSASSAATTASVTHSPSTTISSSSTTGTATKAS